MSALISSTAVSWSGVSVKGKASSSSRCQGVSGPKAWPGEAIRAEYSRTSSAAISRTFLRTLAFWRSHSRLPRRDSLGCSPPT